jgi:hypothetical protein
VEKNIMRIRLYDGDNDYDDDHWLTNILPNRVFLGRIYVRRNATSFK